MDNNALLNHFTGYMAYVLLSLRIDDVNNRGENGMEMIFSLSLLVRRVCVFPSDAHFHSRITHKKYALNIAL